MHYHFRFRAFWVPVYRNALNDVTNKIHNKNLVSFSQEEKLQFWLCFLLQNWECFAHFESSGKITLGYLQLEEWKDLPKTVLFARSMSASAQFSLETSAVSKEVANLSLNLPPYSFWSITFSILPSCAKKSHWTSHPNACLPTKNPQTREVTRIKFLWRNYAHSCAPVTSTCGWWTPTCLLTGHAETTECTAQTPLPLLPASAADVCLRLICAVQGTAEKAEVLS